MTIDAIYSKMRFNYDENFQKTLRNFTPFNENVSQAKIETEHIKAAI